MKKSHVAAIGAAVCAGFALAAPSAAQDAGAQDVCDIVSAGTADAPELESRSFAAARARSGAWMEAQSARDDVTITESGLVYSVLASGDPAGATPEPGQYVCVHYRGILADGSEFDSSCARDEAAAFPSDRLIPGWVEALQMMRAGDIWELHIPPALAYGANGAGDVIGPEEALIFRVAMIGPLDGPVRPGVDCAELE